MPRLSDTRYSANRRARQMEIWGVSQKSFPTKNPLCFLRTINELIQPSWVGRDFCGTRDKTLSCPAFRAV